MQARKKICKSKKELSAIKKAYKKGKLKFNSKDLAKEIIKDLGLGLFKNNNK